MVDRIKYVVLALGVCALPAQAVIVDFEDLTHSSENSNTLYYGAAVDSRGYHFENLTRPADPQALASWKSTATYYIGSVALWLPWGPDDVRMAKLGGGAFTVRSVDLANVFRFNSNFSVTFTGTRADTSTVQETLTVTNPTSLSSYAFSNMADIVKLEWKGGASSSNNPQFDNFDVQAVPEPAVLAGLSFGFVVLGKRKRTKPSK